MAIGTGNESGLQSTFREGWGNVRHTRGHLFSETVFLRHKVCKVAFQCVLCFYLSNTGSEGKWHSRTLSNVPQSFSWPYAYLCLCVCVWADSRLDRGLTVTSVAVSLSAVLWGCHSKCLSKAPFALKNLQQQQLHLIPASCQSSHCLLWPCEVHAGRGGGVHVGVGTKWCIKAQSSRFFDIPVESREYCCLFVWHSQDAVWHLSHQKSWLAFRGKCRMDHAVPEYLKQPFVSGGNNLSADFVSPFCQRLMGAP